MTIPKESILLVDDEEAIRYILNKGLAMRGYVCDEAENAERALAKLEVKPADLVILDINMPGRAGNEVLPEITTRFSETAVIMASGVTDTTTIAQCIKDGAQDYISKPFRFENASGRRLEPNNCFCRSASQRICRASTQSTPARIGCWRIWPIWAIRRVMRH